MSKRTTSAASLMVCTARGCDTPIDASHAPLAKPRYALPFEATSIAATWPGVFPAP